MDSSGTCPACGINAGENPLESRATPDEKEPDGIAGMIEFDCSGPSEAEPGTRSEMPQWRMDLARRLQEIRQKREVGAAGGLEQRSANAPALSEVQLTTKLEDAESAPAKVSATPRVQRRSPRVLKPIPVAAPSSSPARATKATPMALKPVDLPLFRTEGSQSPSRAESEAVSERATASPDSLKDVRNLIDSIVIHPEGGHNVAATTQELPQSVVEAVLPSPDDRLILVSRTLSGLVDLLVVAICTGALIIATDVTSGIDIFDGKSLAVYSLLLFAVFFVYSAFFLGTANQTIGMMLTDLKLINAEDRRPHMGQILWRCFGYLVSVFMLGAGLLWGCFDRQSRCLHDRLSDTRVVRL
ncbi:MAG TPA: RDD family protein [Acidobacteriota bacterium]|nr:RDD family protein [Acidobacteriota bacterium]